MTRGKRGCLVAEEPTEVPEGRDACYHCEGTRTASRDAPWFDRDARRGSARGAPRAVLLIFWAISAGFASIACEAIVPRPAFDPSQCDRRRLDEVADPAGLFRAIPCVIVTWDSEMDGAAIGPGGEIGTPPALVAAAAVRGFATPCETTVSPDPVSPGQPWFVDQFGALDPAADIWGATVFVRLPLPDGRNPACIVVTPPP